MTIRWIVVGLAVGGLARAVAGQLASVRCCTEQHHLESTGLCVSGPGGFAEPGSCPPPATCVLGFGEHVELMPALCDSEATNLPDPLRAFCSEWVAEGVAVVEQCVAKPSAGVSMFSIFDDEQDGDFDLADLAVVGQLYDVTPKLQQSEATLVYMECCVSESAIRGIGQCLSGPGGVTVPLVCDGRATCLAGFSAPIELGDYQYKLCAGGEAPLPKEGVCVAWQVGVQPAHLCATRPIPGNNLFVVSDADGDGDVDLADFAVFQREWGDALP